MQEYQRFLSPDRVYNDAASDVVSERVDVFGRTRRGSQNSSSSGRIWLKYWRLVGARTVSLGCSIVRSLGFLVSLHLSLAMEHCMVLFFLKLIPIRSYSNQLTSWYPTVSRIQLFFRALFGWRAVFLLRTSGCCNHLGAPLYKPSDSSHTWIYVIEYVRNTEFPTVVHVGSL